MAAFCPICRHISPPHADACVGCGRFHFRVPAPHLEAPDDGRIQFDMPAPHSGSETEGTLLPHTLRLQIAAGELDLFDDPTDRYGPDDSPTAPM